MARIHIPAAVQFALTEVRKWLEPLPIFPMDFYPPTRPQRIGPNIDRICVSARYPQINLEVILAAYGAQPRYYAISSVWGTVTIPTEFKRASSTEAFVWATVR